MAESATDVATERKHEGDICDTYSDFNAEYDRIKQLGRQGQYGTTYLCSKKNRDPDAPDTVENPLRVAVKVVNKQRFKDSGPRIYAKWLELQKNEITTLLLARHPNIVRLYRVLEDARYVYLVMEYLPGGELLDFIVKTGKVSEFKVAHICGQVLHALDYMHQRDILHLDLKPENIMLADTNYDYPKVKIIDFGFAAVLPRLEKMIGNRGTPYYMAPEVWRGEYDRAADVWAVGVIAFVMLFGFLPFYDDHSKGGKPNIKEIKRQIKRGFRNETKRGCGPWFPRAIPVSDEAKYFIAHMLRMDVARRYTVEEAMGDRWTRGTASTDTLPEIVLRGLAQFSAAAQTPQRGLVMLVADLNELNSTKLESTESFEAKYAEDGKLQKDEFVKRFSAMCNMRQHEMETMFDFLDTDNDGFITMQTVKMVEAFHQLVAVDDRLNDLFDKLDEDGDGVLNEQELQNALNKVSPQVRALLDVKRLLEVTDHDHDGAIDRDEFMAALHPKNYEPIDEVTRDARNASNFAMTLRQKSNMYYDLLRQCEESDALSPRSAIAGVNGPGMRKQLTVDATLAEVDEDETMHYDEDDDEEYGDDAAAGPLPEDYDDENEPSEEGDEAMVDHVMDDLKMEDMVKQTTKDRENAKNLVEFFSTDERERIPSVVKPDNGAGGPKNGCCVIL